MHRLAAIFGNLAQDGAQRRVLEQMPLLEGLPGFVIVEGAAP
ncbi:hypothetical protein Q427_26315 [Halomonas sp. BC04]|nr:hypothetical protein Q427_26315 [Halomonas sp. BC04]